MKTTLLALALAFAAFLAAPLLTFAAGKGQMTMPDFTKGEAIPAGAKHDWNLGPTGLRGWMFCDKLVTTDARQIAVTAVEKGSPADGLLEVGDVLLGVGGKTFSYDPRTELGKAITAAETEAGGGKLTLMRWRAGAPSEVVVKLPVLGTFSATAPYDCPESERIFEQGIKVLAARVAEPDYAKKLSEYVVATGDQSVLPGLRKLALEAAKGQSGVGSWGHKFARPDGRLFGYGMMNAPGLPMAARPSPSPSFRMIHAHPHFPSPTNTFVSDDTQ